MAHRYRNGTASFTLPQIEDELRRHKDLGNVYSWRKLSRGGRWRRGRTSPMYRVVLADAKMIDLATAYEAHAFVMGLSSLETAQNRREEAWRDDVPTTLPARSMPF